MKRSYVPDEFQVGMKIYVGYKPNLFSKSGQLKEGDLYCTIINVTETFIYIDKYNGRDGFYTIEKLKEHLLFDRLVIKEGAEFE